MIALSYGHMSGDIQEYATLQGVTRDLDLDDRTTVNARIGIESVELARGCCGSH